MFENQTAPYDDVVAAILRLWIVDQVSLACRGYGIVWARSANSKKKNVSAGVPGPNKEQHPNQHHPSIYSNNHHDSGRTTSKMTSNYNFQTSQPRSRTDPAIKIHKGKLNATGHSRSSQRKPRKAALKLTREHLQLCQVAIPPSNGDVLQIWVKETWTWQIRVSTVYHIHIVLCSGGQWRPPARQSETAWRSTSNRNIWSYFTKLTNPLFQMFIFGGGQVPPMFIRFIHIFPMKVSKILKVSSPKDAVVWNQGARSVDWSWQCHAPSRGCPFSGTKMDQGVLLGAFCWRFFWGRHPQKLHSPKTKNAGFPKKKDIFEAGGTWKKTASFLLSMLDFGFFFRVVESFMGNTNASQPLGKGRQWCCNFVLLQQFLMLIPDMYVQQKIDEKISTSVTSD